ncbi:MAG: sigma 54-interacting transcriptional regulator [Planctomycetota bacterium]|nr:sigma 54-interacting transcriptional regulator [Planctomycetota bacterium]
MNGIAHRKPESGQCLIPGSLLVVAPGDCFSGTMLAGLSSASRVCHVARSGAAARDLVRKSAPDVVLVAEELGDMSGMEWLIEHRANASPGDVVMVMTEDGLGRGVEALVEGAVDFLVQPLGLDQIIATLTLVARSRDLQSENDRLHRQLHALQSGTAFVGRSPIARRLVGVLARAAESSAAVLIEGREGSGKTLAARIIHASNRRSDKPLLTEYCESLSPERLGRELTSMHGGTLLLEGIEKLSPAAQSRLVRHLKECSTEPKESGIRILATTSAPLPELVARGSFREDLYYRLSVFPIVVPSLQERRDDIAVLAAHFLKLCSADSKTSANGFTPDAMTMLESHPWTGNVAQLQDAVDRAHALAKGAVIDKEHLLGPSTGLVTGSVAPALQSGPNCGADEVREEDILAFETEEKRLLARALKATQGNVRRAAHLLRIGRATLYRKIQIYKLKLN